ncbi:hypothetical protein FLONG3_3519 [Fusarium longipes]|uniref:Uncharacterized protein n=1 Tax=Fusarium longipes TaxID=694270 RepID=A0A395T0W1_9HYPO|nr:hypothetical protein FLONG3_3519 [Fusarium longipes]
MGDDNGIHVARRDFESGDWSDDTIDGTSFDETVENFIVLEDKDNGELELFVLAGKNLYYVKDGESTQLGYYSDGDCDRSGEYIDNGEDIAIEVREKYGNYHYRLSDQDLNDHCRGDDRMVLLPPNNKSLNW